MSSNHAYTNIVRGRLELKGAPLPGPPGSEKRAKRKKRKRTLDKTTEQPSGTGESDQREEEEDESKDTEQHYQELLDKRTLAEKQADERLAEREAQRIAKKAAKSHRERVEEFNAYLGNLSEHFDTPKVGGGG